MDLKYNTDASLLFGPVIWNGDGYSTITNAFSLCCNTIAVDLFNDTTKTDITVQSGGTNDVVFVANGYASLQLVASQLDAVGHYTLSYQYTSTMPGWRYFEVIQPEAWDAKYGTLASNIVNIKAATTSIAINVSSALAQINVFSASTMRDLTSIAINVNSLVVSTASLLRDTASVAARLVIFNASTAIGIASVIVGVQSTVAKINVMSPSLTVGVASILAQISVFSASAMRDITSISVNVASIFRDVTSANVNISRFEVSTTVGVASILAQISVFSTSAMRDITSLVVAVGGIDASGTAQAVWEFAVSQQSTVGMAGQYLMDAGGVGLAQASILSGVVVCADSVLSNLKAFNASTAIGVASLIVGVQSTIAKIDVMAPSLTVGVASILARINIFSTSVMRDLTSIAISTNSIAVHTLEFGSSASLASAVWGHLTATSAIVAVKSAWSNTVAINTGLLSVASTVWDVVRAEHVTAGTFGEVTSSDSLASQVWGHTTSVSLIVAVKSTLSNAIYCTTLDNLENAVPGAYGVGTAGRVLGQIYVDTTSTLAGVTSLVVTAASIWTHVTVGIASIQVSTASLLVGINSLMVDTASIMVKLASMPNAIWDEPLSQHSTVGVAGAYLYAAAGAYTPADVAEATWTFAVSQQSTVGMAGAYLMAAGGAADPLLNAVPGSYGVGTAGRVLGQIYVDTSSTVISVKSILVATTSIAINVSSVVAKLDVFSPSMTVGIASIVSRIDLWGTSAAVATASLIIGVQSIVSKIDVMSPSITVGIASIVSKIDIWGPSLMVGITSLQANVAQASTMAALNNLSAAEVNAEVVDALNVDTYAEPGQGAPAATNTLVAKIGYLFKNWRNRKTATSTAITVYADNGTTADQLAAQTDDGTTYDKGEMGTGA